MTKRTGLGFLFAALLGAVLTALVVVAPSALAAVYKDISEFRHVRKTNTLGATTYQASTDIYKVTLQTYDFYTVDTTGAAVDLDFGEDVLDAADIGSEWVFQVARGGTNALTVTAGTGVATVKTLNTLGSTCEDVGDTIRVIAYSTTQASVITQCAD